MTPRAPRKTILHSLQNNIYQEIVISNSLNTENLLQFVQY